MEPQVVDNPDAARYEVRLDGAVAGFVQYKRHNRTLSLLHTEIAPEFEGRGLGSALAQGVLEAARDDGADVLPFCPFVRAYLQRHPEHVSLVPSRRREAFGLATGPP